MSFLYIPMSRGSNGSNTFVGVGALQNVTTGVDNSAFGFYALNALVSGNRNTAVGSEALLLNTSSNNTAVGSGALRGSTTGQNNVALGQDAMRAGNPNNSNVAVGYSAMYNCGLTENSVGIGQFALYNAAGTIGNTAVGNTAGLLITTGSKNTILGAFTGNQFGLDIRTLSNYIVISDGDGNPRIWVDNTGLVNFPGGAVLPGGTANGVLYLNASGVVTSGTALVFNGANLGVGVTPSAWAASARALDFAYPSVAMDTTGAAVLGFNAYNSSGTTWNYKTTDEAALFTITNAGAFTWRQAVSGTAGNAISFTQAMTLHASGGLSVGSTSDPGANTIALTKLSIKVDGPFFTGANIDSGSNQLGIGVSSGTAAVGLFTANTERIRIKSQGQLRYIPLAADPAGAENGDVYYNSTTNKLRVYAGGAWVDLH